MIYKIISNIFVGKAPMKQIYIMVLHKNWFAILSFVQKLFYDFKYFFSSQLSQRFKFTPHYRIRMFLQYNKMFQTT